MKIPYDTVMSMPVQHRKVLIAKHNKTDEEMAERAMNGGSKVSGSLINNFAAMSQSKHGG